jgi:5-hydroxyisourate hydrolase-like protein (transthyretin family)
MRATLLAPSVRIHPGTTALLDIEVVNNEDVIDGISARVIGLDPAWVPLVQPVVTLFPDTSGTLTIRFELPTSCAAGESMITVHVYSTIDASRFDDHAVLLHVEPVEAATMELRPSVVEGGSRAQFTTVITNTGNIATEFTVDAVEPTRALQCAMTAPTVLVPAGESRELVLHTRGRRPLAGQILSRNIEVTATSTELELKATARFAQKPRIPRGAITAFILLAIVLLWAIIFLFVVQYMQAKDAATKAVPSTWENGTREVRVIDVAASMSGRVVAASTGEGLAGITVEALRKHGDKFESAASAATGDDGTFALAGLLPGTYKVKYSAEGFEPTFYKGADETTAEEVPVAPVTPVDGLDAVLTGLGGTIRGQIAAPPGGVVGPAMVTITLIPDREDQPPMDVPPPPVDPITGEFSAPGLQTPATYEVRIAREGFAPVVTRVDLKGGPPTLLDTANLTAASGSISGRVVDGAGNGLGNVKVVVRSGNIERSILTPTTGNAGSFTLDALPTPRTYVITFTLAGYSSETLAVDVAGGEPKQLASAVTLVGGAGTVTGIASDADGNPLGGVKVVVAKGAVTAETATLTTGTGPTGQGSYTVSGLPVPGPYTVTFTLAGYQSETRLVGLPVATDTPAVVDVQLARSTSTVSGTVTVTSSTANRSVGLTIELSDGGTARTTVTTSNPAGGYSFADVPNGSYTLTVVDTGVVPRSVLRVVRIVVSNTGDNTHNIAMTLP